MSAYNSKYFCSSFTTAPPPETADTIQTMVPTQQTELSTPEWHPGNAASLSP